MKEYNYNSLKRDIKRLKKIYTDAEFGSIGKSVWGKELFYIRLGKGKRVISFNGAHHGMEWITSMVLVKFAEEYLQGLESGKKLMGVPIETLNSRTSLYIIPMVNPDGVEIATGGKHEGDMKSINPSYDYKRWQANAHGVDLNHNYDAMWLKSKEMEKEYGISGPGATRYSGEYPLSEPETKALADFTCEKHFEMVIAFHSQGKVIYQGFMGKEPPVSKRIAKAFESVSVYKLDETEGIASYGGYKDWFVDKFRRPGFTIELGEGRNPLPIENLPIIYKETLPIMVGAMMI